MTSQKLQGNLFIISAPSGAGKTSLIQALIKSLSNLQLSISHTTRPKRPNEIDGVHYNFVTQEQFLALKAQNVFLESATVFNNYYGTSKLWVQEQLDLGRDIILEIDWQGAAQIRAIMPDAISIFILPPSFSALKERLEKRAGDSAAVIANRMASAKNEISHSIEYEYVIVNDIFNQALFELQAIMTAYRLKMPKRLASLETLLKKLV